LQDVDPKLRLAALVLETVLGHRITLLTYRPGAATATAPSAQAQPAAVPARQRIDLHYEMEQTTFQARGEVEIAGGRSIRFSVELNMQREFQSASAAAAPAATTDPLALGSGSGPVQLTEATVAFDLNSDGQPESIHFVAGGSGFLMLDRNGDGKATDGSELFGPQTGNGFAELAAYDSDGNGWIDEADPVFAKLRIWTPDGLHTLQETGVGAIATSSAEAPFAIKDSANVLLGDVRQTGVYLSESGRAGIVQQVDLAMS
jgi:hypothetical protein